MFLISCSDTFAVLDCFKTRLVAADIAPLMHTVHSKHMSLLLSNRKLDFVVNLHVLN